MVWGVCGHAFHLQCINKCLATQEEQRCPFCRRPWEFKVLRNIRDSRRMHYISGRHLFAAYLLYGNIDDAHPIDAPDSA